MKKLILLTLVIFTLYSCSYYPECNDEDVIEITLDFCINEIKYELAYNKFYKEEFEKFEDPLNLEILSFLSMMDGGGSQDFKKALDEARKDAEKELRKIIEGNSTAEEEEKYSRFISYADSMVANTKIELINIRTTLLDKELSKCDCRADLIFQGIINNENITIEYTAYYTDDGFLLVEVDF